MSTIFIKYNNHMSPLWPKNIYFTIYFLLNCYQWGVFELRRPVFWLMWKCQSAWCWNSFTKGARCCVMLWLGWTTKALERGCFSYCSLCLYMKCDQVWVEMDSHKLPAENWSQSDNRRILWGSAGPEIVMPLKSQFLCSWIRIFFFCRFECTSLKTWHPH